MPAARRRRRIKRPHEGRLAGHRIEQAHVTSEWGLPVEDRIRDSPNRPAKGNGASQIIAPNPHLRELQRTEREPSLQFAGAPEALEPASEPHVAAVREVETQPAKEHEVGRDRHADR
jgi:hypothetical protein